MWARRFPRARIAHRPMFTPVSFPRPENNMPRPTVLVLVRFRSSLARDEVLRVAGERLPAFRALPGLLQKYYLEETEAGEYAGLYLWDSAESLAEYDESELRATIARAYHVEGQPRIEVYRVFEILRDDDA